MIYWRVLPWCLPDVTENHKKLVKITDPTQDSKSILPKCKSPHISLMYQFAQYIPNKLKNRNCVMCKHHIDASVLLVTILSQRQTSATNFQQFCSHFL